MRAASLLFTMGLSLGLLSACGGGGGDSDNGGDGGGAGFVPTNGAVTVTEVATGLPNPWSLAFLPDRRMLITVRTGSLRLYAADGQSFNNVTLAGLTRLTSAGQGGLLDVVVDPSFGSNRRIYFTFSETDAGDPSLNGTAVARAELDINALTLVNLVVIYRQTPKVASTAHYGSRLVFDRDGHLFVTLGDRQSNDQRVFAQDLNRGNGKVAHITTSGAPAPNNPALGGQPELWSYGHRNPQGAALHPDTGELWTSEHGPQGGDEVNLTLAGRNYGWPVISYGQEYGTTQQLGEGTAKAGMEQPVAYWETIDGRPWTGGQKSSIAPSGMAFFTGALPTHWNRSLFVGALAGTALWRLQLDGTRVVGRERLLAGRNERIRDVRQGPDGRLYLLTDGGSAKLLRIGG
jgi:glucose/arabinose dehydrogenase